MSLLGIQFSFRGAPRFFSLSLFYSERISHFIGVWGSHQLANFIVQMGSGTGQLPGLSRKDRLWPGFALWSAVPHPTTTKLLACSYLQLSHLPTLHPQDLRRFGGQQPICEDTWLFTGGEISFTRAPVIWTVSNEANLVTSTDEQPRAGLGSIAPQLMKSLVVVTTRLLSWQISSGGSLLESKVTNMSAFIY